MGFDRVSWLGGLAALTACMAPAPLFVHGAVAQAAASGAGARGGAGFHGQAPRSAPLGFGPAPASGVDFPGPATLRDFLFGGRQQDRRSPPPLARYQLDGGDGFVVQRSGSTALLKFEDSPEVWALTAMSGPRGDTIFKNDVGEPVLRFTRLGGVTVFTDERPGGAAAAMAGAASPVRPQTSIGPNALFQALAQSSARASRAAQHLIAFEVVPDATPKTDWLFADAAVVAAEAFVRLANQGLEGRMLAARFGKVELLQGQNPDADSGGGVVHITVAPGRGVAGRPSSQKIYLVLHRR